MSTSVSGSPGRVKVLLMTTGDRYQQYFMEVIGSQVSFFHLSPQEKGAIWHSLDNIHLTSTDSATKKVLCSSRRHFGLTITSHQGHRKLYFMTYEQMLAGADFLMKAQKFRKRLEQYVF